MFRIVAIVKTHLTAILLSAFTLLNLEVNAQEPTAVPEIGVAFIADQNTEILTDLRDQIQQELMKLARSEFELGFPPEFSVISTGLPEQIASDLKRLMNEPSVSIVVTLGLISSELAVSTRPLVKPVIASTVFDATYQGFPMAQGGSGVPNLTYVSPPNPGPVIRDLKKFQEIVPFTRSTLLIEQQYLQLRPNVIENLLDAATEMNIDLDAIPVGGLAETVLEQIPANTEVVYVTPLPTLTDTEFEKIVDGLNVRRIPSFSFSEHDVHQGIMGSLGSSNNQLLARRIAVSAYRILQGDDPSTLPVTLEQDTQLVLNMDTVRKLGLVLPVGEILTAHRVNEVSADVQREVTLISAIKETIESNLNLAIEDESIQLAKEDLRLARSLLLPSVSSNLVGTANEQSVAASSFGLRPEYSVDAGLSVSQVIFSHEANANLAIQRYRLKASSAQRESVELDLALQASEAYFNVLRGKSIEEAQQANLELTLSNLVLAQKREQIGASGPGERLRLEGELARRKADRISAYAHRNAAEVALNQVLNRPLDEKFLTSDGVDLSSVSLQKNYATRYLTDINQRIDLTEFLVGYAVGQSPEISQLNQLIKAQERSLKATRQSFYLPTIAIQGGISSNLMKEGEGGNPPIPLPTQDITDYPWNANLSFSFPLISGGERTAQQSKVNAAVKQLKHQRELIERQLEQNVRSQLLFARASFAMLRENEAAAVTANESMGLVSESFAQGVADVVDLLNAQGSVLLSELGVSNAVFDYLINLKRVERVVGIFEVLTTPEEQAELLDQYQDFVDKRRTRNHD